MSRGRLKRGGLLILLGVLLWATKADAFSGCRLLQDGTSKRLLQNGTDGRIGQVGGSCAAAATMVGPSKANKYNRLFMEDY